MPEPIRVLHMLPDLRVGGGQHLLARHLAGMDPAAVENHVCYARPPAEMGAAFERAGVRIHGLDLAGAAGLPRAGGALLRLIDRLRIEVLHTNNTALDRTLGYYAALRRRLPVVNSLHSEFHALPPGLPLRARLRELPHRVTRRLSLWAARRVVEHVVAVSRGVQRSWEPYLRQQGIGPERISVVYPGLDPARFERPPDARLDSLRTALGIRGAAPVLLNVGRLVYGKGQRHLIPMMPEVLRAHPRAVLLLAGDGPDQGTLEGMIRERTLGESVRLLGRREDVADLLWLADLFLFPSHTEGFPLSVLEAMAAARAVVAFQIPAFDELVTQGVDAELVPLMDEARLSAAAMSLLADPPRRAAMGAAAQRTVRRFSQQASSEALAAIYRRLAEPARRARGEEGRRAPASA